MRYVSNPAEGPLRGDVFVPGDKSLSHRAVLFAAMAEGRSRLSGVLNSADVRSTIAAVRALGAVVDDVQPAEGGQVLDLTVQGWGERGPLAPSKPLDCGNSGTTARLLLGVLASWPIVATLVGDDSLSKRPMDRVTGPLERMGAQFESGGNTLPITVHGGGLTGIHYESPIASAQVKTAVLLAGLNATGRTTVTEPSASRDHTERLLPKFGVPVGREVADNEAWVEGPAILHAADVPVPRDPSSAAFLVVAAVIVPDSEVLIPAVTLNPTRTGFMSVLERMGAKVEVRNLKVEGAELVGTIVARFTEDLAPTTIEPHEVASLVDEVPILAVAAARASGTTRFEGVGELRVKESDRLAAIVEGLTNLGASARAEADALIVDGPATLTSANVDSLGDHRLAMAWAVAGLAADGPVTIDRFESVDVSYPSFASDVEQLLS